MALQTKAVDVLLGAQWGDEGKGKLVDILASSGGYSIVARVAGGSNAGHTIVVNERRYEFHQVPSAMLNEQVVCILGNGVVVNCQKLIAEIDKLVHIGIPFHGRLFISSRAHIVFDFHMRVDELNEEMLSMTKLGTTKQGIGPAYATKAMRNGLRVGDLQDFDYFEFKLRALIEYYQMSYGDQLEIDVEMEIAYYRSIRDVILPLCTDTALLIHQGIEKGERVLIEGANATMLDIDHGTFPYVTSSNSTIGGAITGLGFPPNRVGEVIGVIKAYCTRVGEGPFPTELKNKIGEDLQVKGAEFGVTTGRPRRCGWLDIPQLLYAIMLNGFTALNLTKIDIFTGFDEIKIGTEYRDSNGEKIHSMPSSLKTYSSVEVIYEVWPGWSEDIGLVETFSELPPACRNYIQRVEELLGVPIRWVGVGSSRNAIIDRGFEWHKFKKPTEP
jgi:adenylosuccinate synthase